MCHSFAFYGAFSKGAIFETQIFVNGKNQTILPILSLTNEP